MRLINALFLICMTIHITHRKKTSTLVFNGAYLVSISKEHIYKDYILDIKLSLTCCSCPGFSFPLPGTVLCPSQRQYSAKSRYPSDPHSPSMYPIACVRISILEILRSGSWAQDGTLSRSLSNASFTARIRVLSLLFRFSTYSDDLWAWGICLRFLLLVIFLPVFSLFTGVHILAVMVL